MARVLYLDVETPCVDHGLKGNRHGYGRTFVRGENRKMFSHRYVFWREHGYLPPVVMHTCDNPRCINIEHLAPGDWVTNNRDRAAKGRSAKRRDSRRKINDEQAAEIRRRFALRKPPPQHDLENGVSALAREFGVDPNVIYNIAYGRTHFA